MLLEKLDIDNSLKHFISSCHYIESKEFHNHVPKTIGYPEATPELIILLEGKLKVTYKLKSFNIDKSCFFTFIDSPIIVEPSSNIKIIKLVFKPLGVFPLTKLTKLSSKELIDSPILLVENLFSTKFKELEKNLLNADETILKEKILSDFLMKEFNQQKLSDKELLIIKALESDFSSVKELCNVLNMETKSLQRWFKHNLGFTPKFFLRLKRFKYLIRDLSYKERADYLNIALINNFYDQNHMIKEAKYFSNSTPTDIDLDIYFSKQIKLP